MPGEIETNKMINVTGNKTLNTYSGLGSRKEEKLLKNMVFLYFLLLIFEGGLRKWVLPGLAAPLLIVRDPVAVFLIFKSMRLGIFPNNGFIKSMLFVGVIGLITALVFGHGNIFVALYGLRILVLHFPVIFIIGRVLNRNDVIRMGKFTVFLAIPMAILIAMQFYSPQSAWVNRGVGGDLDGAGFTGALGFMRPPGTFSFTNGNTLFFSLAGVFILYFWLNPSYINKTILIAATVGLAAAIPLSISRALFFQVCLTIVFILVAIARKPKYIGKVMMAGVGVVAVFLVLSNYSFFKVATEAFTYRFEGANETEGGLKGVLGDRYVGGMIRGIISEQPFFGYGLGMGTSVGGMLLTGQSAMQMGEDEWGRIIGELGLVLGLVMLGTRLSLCYKLLITSFKWLKTGDLLPWILTSFCLTTIPQGQWAQPTALGFTIIIGGLNIAAFRKGTTQTSKSKFVKKPEKALQEQE